MTPLACPSKAGYSGSRGALMGRLQCNLVWMTVAVVIIGLVVLLAMPAAHDWNVRDFSDPMVLSHVMIVFPLAVALYKRMHWTAVLIAVSGVASLFYHAFREDDLGFAIWDSYLAMLALLWVITIFGVSLTMCPDREIVWMVATMLVLSGAFYFTPWLMPEGDNKDCLSWRLHPMWHMVGYAGIALALTNFNKEWLANVKRMPSSELFRPTRAWVRDLQDFSW